MDFTKELNIVRKLGAGMEPSGYELHIFRYILNPLFKNGLPKKSQLHELYLDVMQPKVGNDQALALVWFGLTIIDTVDPSPLEPLIKVDLSITNEEVVFRKMLVDVARELSSDAEKSKQFIQVVIAAQDLGNCPNTRQFMPPQEKQENPSAFLPYIIKLFEEAEDQCVIEPNNLVSLKTWLKSCEFIKITRDTVEKFNPNDTISKHWEGGTRIRGRGRPGDKARLPSQCSEEDTHEAELAIAGRDSKSGTPMSTSTSEDSSEYVSADGPDFKKSEQERGNESVKNYMGQSSCS